jgi:hypothetical protein
VGHRLEQGLYAGNHQARRLGRLQGLQKTQPVAVSFIVGQTLGRKRFANWEPFGDRPAEEGQVVDQAIDLIEPLGDDHQRTRGMFFESGGRQRARRPPDSIQSRRMARFQTLDDLREAFLVHQPSD